ncbi:response regulator transcription factor [Kutzneria viridogrisea]|uniref:Uncharacterized protein n=2 Tax=Kutzneria TaxID=43356 RepID=W5WRH9_9PSEU|nr:response regulator transcription factor [Kutzneria albida]AHI00780.1 hypothetical protein KALB_7422 [Kutzneria albida DSM 43870]MBA8926056.1 DNA-binding NarL/FixJ family response regulator [Kutzneria viridogrisea]
MIRVLLVDDHPVVRAGLRALLAEAPDVELVGEAGDGQRAVELAAQADVVLMDLQLGQGIDGAEATRRICAGDSGARVLVLTTYDSDADILRAIEAGATGYLLKDTQPAELLRAIRGAASGQTVLAPLVASRLGARKRMPGTALTARETEILQLAAEGASNRAIARQLFITEATVKSHLVQVFGKLGVDNRTAATAEGRRRGVIR